MGKKGKIRPDPASFELPQAGVDSHAHLDLKGLAEDIKGVVKRARDSGIINIGQVFLGPEAYEQNRYLFSNYLDVIFFLLGIHPHDARHCSQDALQKIEQALGKDQRIRALGEIGLDFYYDLSPRNEQVKAFQDQLVLARENDLPVVIHSRQAEQETVNILLDQGFKDRPLIWHCFGRDADFARRIVKMGWMVSIPGAVTFAKSFELQQAVTEIPLQNLLLETDCPFLTPEPYRGKQNEPALMVFTADMLARLKQVPVSTVWTSSGKNALDFFF